MVKHSTVPFSPHVVIGAASFIPVLRDKVGRFLELGLPTVQLSNLSTHYHKESIESSKGSPGAEYYGLLVPSSLMQLLLLMATALTEIESSSGMRSDHDAEPKMEREYEQY
jgi:hypothetical protein